MRAWMHMPGPGVDDWGRGREGYVPREVHLEGKVVVQVGKGDAVLCTHGLPDNDLVDVIELIPVLIPGIKMKHVNVRRMAPVWGRGYDNLLKFTIFDQRLKLGASRNGQIECLSSEEGLEVKQVEVVFVYQVSQQLVGQTVEGGQLRQRQVPAPIRATIDVLRIGQRLMIIEPVEDWFVLIWIQFHLDCLKRLHVQHVVCIIQWRLFIIKGRKTHAFEVPSVTFLTTHCDPHGAPLSDVHRFNHPRNLVDKGDGASDVVEYLDIADLFPGHGHVLHQLQHSVWHVLESTKVNPLVVTVFTAAHVTVVANDLSHMLRRHVFFLSIDKTKFALLGVTFGLKLLPFACLLLQLLLGHDFWGCWRGSGWWHGDLWRGCCGGKGCSWWLRDQLGNLAHKDGLAPRSKHVRHRHGAARTSPEENSNKFFLLNPHIKQPGHPLHKMNVNISYIQKCDAV